MIYSGRAGEPSPVGESVQRKTEMIGMLRENIRLRVVLMLHWSFKDRQERLLKCKASLSRGPGSVN